MDVLIWAILVVVFIVVELATVQLVSLWFAAGAIVTMICAFLFDLPLIGQLGIFIISSLIFLAVTLPFIRQRQKKGHISTNAELDIGRSAVVIEDIDPDKGTGRVTLNGVDWSAVSENGEPVTKDSIVTVTAVNGAKLTVRLKQN